MTSRSPARERILVGSLLLGLLLAFFHESILGARVLSAADVIFASPFFAARAPQGFTRPANELLFDAAYQFVPWRKLACESLRRGELPLWNPYSQCGTPFVATMQSAVFYPINLSLCAVPFARMFVWGAVIRLWVAGFATYLLGRLYGLGVVAALVAGVSFMFCGFLIVWLEHPHVNVAVWLPALILCGERLLRASTPGARVRWMAWLAGVVAIQFTGGHIETSTNLLACLVTYYCVRWYQLVAPRSVTLRAKIAPLALGVVALVLGAALAGEQLLPFLEWLPLSAEFARRRAATLPLIDSGSWRQLLSIPLFLFPNLYNNPTWPGPYRSFLPWGNYNEDVLYVGTLTLLLAMIAVAASLRNPVTKCWGLLGALSLGMALRLPVLDWLNRLPGLRFAHPGRLRLLTSFSLCMLAGFGIAALCDAEGPVRARLVRFWRRASAGVIAAGVLLAVSATVALPLFQDRIATWGRGIAARKYEELARPSRPLEYFYEEVDRLADGLKHAFRIDNPRMYAPVLWALAGLAIVELSRRRWSMSGPLLLIVALDVTTFGHGYHPSIPMDEFYPSTPLASRVATDPGRERFTALGEDMIPDAHMMYGIADPRGLDYRTSWYEGYLGLVPDRPPWIPYGVILASAASPFVRVLNLKYIATARREALMAEPDVKVVEEDGGMLLAELRHVQPRSFMVYQAIVVMNDAAAFEMLRAVPDAVYSRAVLVAPPDGPSPVAMTSPGREPMHDVMLVRYQRERASWRVATEAPGYLVSTDSYYPGWQAYLDDRPAPLFRADGAFRAVHVPAGEHVVTFRYQPRSVLLGFVSAALSLLVILGMLLRVRGKP